MNPNPKLLYQWVVKPIFFMCQNYYADYYLLILEKNNRIPSVLVPWHSIITLSDLLTIFLLWAWFERGQWSVVQSKPNIACTGSRGRLELDIPRYPARELELCTAAAGKTRQTTIQPAATIEGQQPACTDQMRDRHTSSACIRHSEMF